MFSILLDESVWGERKLHYFSVWLDMETAFLLAFPSFAPFFFPRQKQAWDKSPSLSPNTHITNLT